MSCQIGTKLEPEMRRRVLSRVTNVEIVEAQSSGKARLKCCRLFSCTTFRCVFRESERAIVSFGSNVNIEPISHLGESRIDSARVET
jgi:hypothetical protein